MRLYVIGIPLGIGLACVGGLLFLASMRPPRENGLTDEPRHPVLLEMLIQTARMGGKRAVPVSTKDVKNRPVQIAVEPMAKPEFVYFIEDGCPCSYTAEPLFHALYRQFGGRVDFIGVTNADKKGAEDWLREMGAPYPLISDPELKIIHDYEAKSSAYSALISKQGRIVKMWPGFSRGFLLEMNHLIAAELGEPERPFDTEYAPIKQATGCAFPNVSSHPATVGTRK